VKISGSAETRLRIEFSLCSTLSYLVLPSSENTCYQWIKRDESGRILVLDISLSIYFGDKYFRTEGVLLDAKLRESA
jgi:hypothetical protein